MVRLGLVVAAFLLCASACAHRPQPPVASEVMWLAVYEAQRANVVALKAAVDAEMALQRQRGTIHPDLEKISAELGALAAEERLDVKGDVTQLMQMRLQKYLDAYTKSFEMLSNILKKQSEASENTIRNMK